MLRKAKGNGPRTYAEWNTLLSALRAGKEDEATLMAMRQGTLEWQTGVAERFTRKLTDAVNERLNRATDQFQKAMLRSRGQERVIVPALLALRKELRFLEQAVNLPAIPEEQREQYRQLIVSHADSIQRSLEDSAKGDRTGKLASIVRNNRVNSF